MYKGLRRLKTNYAQRKPNKIAYLTGGTARTLIRFIKSRKRDPSLFSGYLEVSYHMANKHDLPGGNQTWVATPGYYNEESTVELAWLVNICYLTRATFLYVLCCVVYLYIYFHAFVTFHLLSVYSFFQAYINFKLITI